MSWYRVTNPTPKDIVVVDHKGKAWTLKAGASWTYTSEAWLQASRSVDFHAYGLTVEAYEPPERSYAAITVAISRLRTRLGKLEERRLGGTTTTRTGKGDEREPIDNAIERIKNDIEDLEFYREEVYPPRGKGHPEPGDRGYGEWLREFDYETWKDWEADQDLYS